MTVLKQCAGVVRTNAYFLIDDLTGEAAMIDCPCKSDVLDELAKDERIKKLKYIILTHGHYDHILGVKYMVELTGAQVIIHSADAECLVNPRASLAAYRMEGQEPFENYKTVNDGDVIELGSLKIKVMHTPGHTKGCMCLIVNDVIFSGDTLFYNDIGRTDLPGGSYEEILSSLKKLDALDGDFKVNPGHGPSTTLDFERENNRYFSLDR